MLTEAEAVRIAREYLLKTCRMNEDTVLVENQTIRKPYGWILHFQSKDYLKTGNMLYSLVGNGPVIVDIESQTISTLPTCYPPDVAIRKYEDWKERKKMEQQNAYIPQSTVNHLFSGLPIGVDIALSNNELATPDSVPFYPVREFHVTITVFPLMGQRYEPFDTAYPVVRQEEPLRGFKVLYVEVPQDMVGYELDISLLKHEYTVVSSLKEVEALLRKYGAPLKKVHVIKTLRK